MNEQLLLEQKLNDINIYSFMYCTYFDDGGVVEGNYSNYRELKECVCGNIKCKSYNCISIIKIIDNEIHIINSIKINFTLEGGGWKFRYYANNLPTILIKWIKMVDTVFVKDTSMYIPYIYNMTFTIIEENIKTKEIIRNSAMLYASEYNYQHLPYELWLDIYEMILTFEEYTYIKYKKN